MEKKIKIACQGADLIPINQLEPFQGELKSLSSEDYERLKKEILELGFSEAISVWKSEEKFYILNGHQRVRTIKHMMEQELYECPPLPICYVTADDYKQAKRKVLALTSQYGRMERQGLYEFMTDAEIDPGELAASFRFPEVDIPSFNAEFFHDQVGTQDNPGASDEHKPMPRGSTELSPEDFSKFDCKCPRCGFFFNHGEKPREKEDAAT